MAREADDGRAARSGLRHLIAADRWRRLRVLYPAASRARDSPTFIHSKVMIRRRSVRANWLRQSFSPSMGVDSEWISRDSTTGSDPRIAPVRSAFGSADRRTPRPCPGTRSRMPVGRLARYAPGRRALPCRSNMVPCRSGEQSSAVRDRQSRRRSQRNARRRRRHQLSQNGGGGCVCSALPCDRSCRLASRHRRHDDAATMRSLVMAAPAATSASLLQCSQRASARWSPRSRSRRRGRRGVVMRTWCPAGVSRILPA